MYGCYFAWWLPIFINYGATSEIAHGYDMIGVIHAVHFDTKYVGIDISAASIEVGCMDVYHKRLARNRFCVYTGGIADPVVCVDDIELFRTRNHSCYDRVVVDFLQKIIRIATGKGNAAGIVRISVAKISINMVAQPVVFLRRGTLSKVRP